MKNDNRQKWWKIFQKLQETGLQEKESLDLWKEFFIFNGWPDMAEDVDKYILEYDHNSL